MATFPHHIPFEALYNETTAPTGEINVLLYPEDTSFTMSIDAVAELPHELDINQEGELNNLLELYGADPSTCTGEAYGRLQRQALTHVVGWVMHSQGSVTLQLFLDDKLVASFSPYIARPDVQAHHSANPNSLLAGFAVPLPIPHLYFTAPGRLRLDASCGVHRTPLWHWEPRHLPCSRRATLEEYREFYKTSDFPECLPTSSAKAITLQDRKIPLHVVLHASAELDSLTALLRHLFWASEETPGRVFRLSSISLFIDNPSLIPAAQEGINSLALNQARDKKKQRPLPCPISVQPTHHFISWTTLYEHSQGLVLTIGNIATNLTGLNLDTLIKCFATDANTRILSAFNIDGALVQMPLGTTPSQVQKLGELEFGRNNLLYGLQQPGTVFLSTIEYLKANAVPSQKMPYPFFPTPAAGDLIYADQRQIVLSRPPLRMDLKEKAISCAENMRRLERRAVHETSAGPLLLAVVDPVDFNTPGLETACEHFINTVESISANVLFVNAKQSENCIIAEKQCISLEELCDHLRGATSSSFLKSAAGLILGFSDATVQTVHTLAYIFNYPVALFDEIAQTDWHHLTEAADVTRWRSWARNSDILRLSICPPKSDPLGQAVSIGVPKISPIPLPSTPRGVITIQLPLTRKSGLDAKALQLMASVLNRKYPGVPVQLLAGELDPGTLRTITNNAAFDRIQLHPRRAERAKLYQASQLTILPEMCRELSYLGCEAHSYSTAQHILCAYPLPAHPTPALNPCDLAGSLAHALESFGTPAPADATTPPSLAQLTQAIQKFTTNLARLRGQRCNYTVIIPVHNALDATSVCLRTLTQLYPSLPTIVVNDASSIYVSNWLEEFCSRHDNITLIHLKSNHGFIGACYAGFNAANPSHDVCLLNSDTAVTSYTFSALQNAAYARHNIGIASSLSTGSAKLQLDLNPGDTIEDATAWLQRHYTPRYPTVITAEGQLIYFRRWALEKFGFFDCAYGAGFCEESDLCMRMFTHGVDMVAADNSVIFHRRSASFGSAQRLALYKTNRTLFDARWLRFYLPAFEKFKKDDSLGAVRTLYRQSANLICHEPKPFVVEEWIDGALPRALHSSPFTHPCGVISDAQIVFVLVGLSASGGVISVLQHANELILQGVRAKVLVLGTAQEDFNYPLLVEPLIIPPEQIFSLDWGNQLVVSTLWLTAYITQALAQRHRNLRLLHYVQDYEGWFYSPSSQYHQVQGAKAVHDLGIPMVCKTEFLKQTVESQHPGAHIDTISPGLLRTVFYPGEQEHYNGPPRIAAMLRSRTPRRGPQQLVEILAKLKARVPEAQITLFGDEQLPTALEGLASTKGKLSQEQVADLYRNTDITIDTSLWHGFGRVGIESMACGAVPVLSNSGGLSVYAKDGVNSLIYESNDLNTAVEHLVRLALDHDFRSSLRRNGVPTGISESVAAKHWRELVGKERSKIARHLPAPDPMLKNFNSR